MVGAGGSGISEHAFGNAIDIAAFTLADGRRITVQEGWHGTPEEQGFLHDVHLAACDSFTTVLAPGYNAAHYNHIHVDLMRRSSGERPCRPEAIPGEEDHVRRAPHSLGIFGHRRVDAEPLEREAERREVRPARADDDDVAVHSVPFVDGSSSPRRAIAWRSVRATPLKHTSTM